MEYSEYKDLIHSNTSSLKSIKNDIILLFKCYIKDKIGNKGNISINSDDSYYKLPYQYYKVDSIIFDFDNDIFQIHIEGCLEYLNINDMASEDILAVLNKLYQKGISGT